jgi:hypothetical protein
MASLGHGFISSWEGLENNGEARVGPAPAFESRVSGGIVLKADRAVDGADKEAAIPAQAGVGGAMDDFDHFPRDSIVANDLNLDVTHVSRRVRVGVVAAGLILAATESADAGEAGARESLDLVEGTRDGFLLDFFDIGFDFLHGSGLLIGIINPPLK